MRDDALADLVAWVRTLPGSAGNLDRNSVPRKPEAEEPP
jgi:hypothetical protein